MKLDELLAMSRKNLRRVLDEGHAIEEHALDDTEYKGVSLGLPRFVERLTWKTFTKTFHRDPETGELRGWNVRMEQTGIDGPPVPIMKNGTPLTWGHYRVYPFEPSRSGPGKTLMIDYQVASNPFLMRRTRDPLVAVNAGDPSLLLGVSYLDLGFFKLWTPTWFALVRRGPLTQPIAVP